MFFFVFFFNKNFEKEILLIFLFTHILYGSVFLRLRKIKAEGLCEAKEFLKKKFLIRRGGMYRKTVASS